MPFTPPPGSARASSDVLLRRVEGRRVVPARRGPRHRARDQLTPGDALGAVPRDRVRVEALEDRLAELGRGRLTGEIRGLARIGRHIEQLLAVPVDVDVLPAAAPDHEARSAHLLD